MNDFDQTHLRNIKTKFQAKTGVELAPRRGRPVRIAALLAAALVCCLSLTAAAYRAFSTLDGDALTLYSVYHGEGIVTVHVENRSDKVLDFQPVLKLTQWNTSEELTPHGSVTFEDTRIEPHSTGVMTIDLSGAYDVAALEVPLADDHYYLTLTNDNFIFGQDWMCSVDFCEHLPIELPEPGSPEALAVDGIDEALRPYFLADSPTDPAKRAALESEYLETLEDLLDEAGVDIVPSICPSMLVGPAPEETGSVPRLLVADPEETVIFDSSFPAERQRELIGLNYHSHDWQFKRLAGKGEGALVLKAGLPLKKYQDAVAPLPLFYIFTYEKSAIGPDSHAYIRGRLLSFGELEQYKVYETEDYVCYEVSPLFYDDPLEYAASYAAWDTSVRWDEAAEARVRAIYDYYKENLPDLLYFK